MTFKKNLFIFTKTFSFLLIVIVAFFAFINVPPGQKIVSDILTKSFNRKVVFSGAFYPQFALPLTLHISKLMVVNSPQGKADDMANIGGNGNRL